MRASFVLAVGPLAIVAACGGATTSPSRSTRDEGGTGSSGGGSSSSSGGDLADSGDASTAGATCSGAGCPVVLASAQNWAKAIAVDATSVYWTTGDSVGPGTVMKMPIGGGTPTTLASAQYELQGDIAVDATNVYWTSWGNRTASGNTGTVMKVPIGGGTLTTLASGQPQPTPITVDATSVYWTDGANVMKIAK